MPGVRQFGPLGPRNPHSTPPQDPRTCEAVVARSCSLEPAISPFHGAVQANPGSGNHHGIRTFGKPR
eukprot:8552970-Alexandrium_andersonii.AAC.1